MRHKYATTGLVLARTPLAEAGMLVTVVTPELGLIRARAEGVRRSGAKLAHALQSWNESGLMLVRGKEGWRITGAVLEADRFSALSREARMRASRISGLLLRLVHGESGDTALHTLFCEYLEALAQCEAEEGEDAETLAALRILSVFGVDAGAMPPPGWGSDALTYANENRRELVARINKGISASGL